MQQRLLLYKYSGTLSASYTTASWNMKIQTGIALLAAIALVTGLVQEAIYGKGFITHIYIQHF